MKFKELLHRYERNKKVYTSVTTLIGKYKQKFNRRYWAKYKAYEKILGKVEFKRLKTKYHPDYRSFNYDDFKFFSFLQKQTKLDLTLVSNEINSILESYKDEATKASIKGTEYHNFKENEAIENKYSYHPLDGVKIETKSSVIKTEKNGSKIITSITEDLYTLEDGYYPEMLLWNDEYMISGQADRVFIETVGDIRYVTIDDYKTNKAIKTSGMSKMKNPINHLWDCNYNHYRLQISFYGWLLTQFGFTIKDVMFTHLNKPYHFDYMESEVKSILRDLKGGYDESW